MSRWDVVALMGLLLGVLALCVGASVGQFLCVWVVAAAPLGIHWAWGKE